MPGKQLLAISALVFSAWATQTGVRASAQAAPAPPAGPAYGIQAGLLGQTTLPGNHFTYGLAAGTGVDDFVVLFNYTDAPLTLSLYPADVRTAVGGGLAPAQSYETMKQVGAWVHLESGSGPVTVAPHGQVARRFRLSVPAATVPGDYVGALVAALTGPAAPGGLSLETRAARLIRLSVPGQVHLGVSVQRPQAFRHMGTEDFEVVVRNTGNVLFAFTAAVVIDGGPARVTAPVTPSGIYVIPGGRATVKARWVGLPVVGRRTARAELAVAVAAKPAGTFRSPQLQLTFFPWSQAMALGAAVVAVILVFLLTRGRRRAWLVRRREERAVLRHVRAELRAGRAVTPIEPELHDPGAAAPGADEEPTATR